LAIVAGTLVAIALVSPSAAVALFAGFTTAGGVTLRRRSRLSPGPRTRRHLPRLRVTSGSGTGSGRGSSRTGSAPSGPGRTAGS
jgi:hypothetical protein